MKLIVHRSSTALTVSKVFIWSNSVAVRNSDAVPALETKSDGSFYKYSVLTRWCMNLEGNAITWRDKRG